MPDAAPDDVFAVTLPPRPYPGLRPFGKDEWAIFFGREPMIDDVIGRLVRQRLLVVHGDSGCGKSSLIRAGVLPRLEQDAARGGRRWITRAMTPGDEPILHLAEALTDAPGAVDADPETRRLRLRRILNCGRDGNPSGAHDRDVVLNEVGAGPPPPAAHTRRRSTSGTLLSRRTDWLRTFAANASYGIAGLGAGPVVVATWGLPCAGHETWWPSPRGVIRWWTGSVASGRTGAGQPPGTVNLPPQSMPRSPPDRRSPGPS